MTLQDTRTPQQMMQDFYGQTNVNVPHYNGRYQEEQKNKRMASEVFSGLDPENFESVFSVAQTPRGDATPIYFDDHMKQYAPRPFGPQQFPEYMQAGGPSLFPIKEPAGRIIKGTRKGVRTFEENDLKNQQGIIKASVDFLNQFA